VPIDLENVDPRGALCGHGFDPNLITVVSLLGVAQYISLNALDRVLRFVIGLRVGSELVISIVLPHQRLSGSDLDASQRSARFTASIGEPWITLMSPDQLSARLSHLGFRDVFHLTPDNARDLYLASDTAAPGWEQLFAARV
jgi:O-methyltransferase involved in polyketide biosynthesis